MNDNTHTNVSRSILGALRSAIPTRSSVTFREALRIAEIQAAKLLQLLDISDFPVLDETIAGLPRIRIEHSAELPTSGLSFWNGERWIIQLSTRQSRARQRFTLFHEYKHIVEHGSAGRIYRGNRWHTAEEQAELAADFFAGCVLIPRSGLKRAWGSGIQSVPALAELFDVSRQAIKVRLDQTGLTERPEPCKGPGHAPRWWAEVARRSITSRSRGAAA